MLGILSLLLVAPSALAAPLTELEQAQQQVQQQRWQSGLDASVYPASPYTDPAQLPAIVEIETHYQAFNDYYYFALVDGRVWYKPRFKRPAGERDWAIELDWKPFGLNQGLPYRLDHRKAEKLDSTFADGDRSLFVEDLHFRDAKQSDWQRWIDVEGWSSASTWTHAEDLSFDEDFPRPQRILALTADDDELAVLTEQRQMFYRRKVANLFVNTEWYQGWGQSKDLPVHFPDHLTGHRGWSIGRITAFGTGYKEGPDGRIFEWGPAAVSMETLVWLSPDGRKLYYLDSGTPPEVAHFVEAPFRGQYQGEAVDSSASTIMLIDRFGAVQTKIADFDLLGSTPTHPYCYFEQCDDQPHYPPGDIRSGMSPIRLPPEGWQVHPPVMAPESWDEDNRLSRRVMIVATGKGNHARELRVVGLREGVVGTWFKELDATRWSFRPAPEGDRAFSDIEEDLLPLETLRQFDASSDLAAMHSGEPSLDQELVGQLQLDSDVRVDLRLLDHNLEASPWHATLSWRDVQLPVDVHVVQAWNPKMPPHSADAGVEVQTFEATLAFDRPELERTMVGGEASSLEGLAVRRLLDDAEGSKFGLIINTTTEGFEVRPKRFKRVGRGMAVALRPDLAPDSHDVQEWSQVFWDRQRGHMGWAQELAALAPVGSSCEALEPAGRVLELEQRIQEDLRALRSTVREARRFSTFTFLTSGVMYITQLKTLQAALEDRRAWRGADVRPNELRFNVITGVTTRIPYLSANISKVQKRRWRAARDEARALDEQLRVRVREAKRLGKECG